MKFVIVMILCLITISIALKSHRRSKTHKTKLNDPITEWNSKNEKLFIFLAGLGYCKQSDTSQEVNKLPIFEFLAKTGWEHITTSVVNVEYDENIKSSTRKGTKYPFTIIKNNKQNKVIVSFSGSDSDEILLEQMSNSGQDYYNKDNNITIMSFFNHIFQKIKAEVYKHIKTVQKTMKPDTQYIFTGHSLGGAMATIFAYDALVTKQVKTLKYSPALITFGAPRIGNYGFANEVSKKIKVIFRVINAGDTVVSLPTCRSKKDSYTDCNSGLKTLQTELVASVTDYTPETADSTFYPWHIRGLIINDEGETHKCLDTSEDKTTCSYKSNMISSILNFASNVDSGFDIHTHYYDYQVSQICSNNYSVDIFTNGVQQRTKKSFLGSLWNR